MTGPTRWIKRVFFAVFLISSLVYWLTHSAGAFVAIILPWVIWRVYVVCTVSCPQCNRQLQAREVADDCGRRLYYDCPLCHISWKSEIVNTD